VPSCNAAGRDVEDTSFTDDDVDDVEGAGTATSCFGMKITDAKLSSESTLVSLCKLLSLDESEPSSRDRRRSTPSMLRFIIVTGTLLSDEADFGFVIASVAVAFTDSVSADFHPCNIRTKPFLMDMLETFSMFVVERLILLVSPSFNSWKRRLAFTGLIESLSASNVRHLQMSSSFNDACFMMLRRTRSFSSSRSADISSSFIELCFNGTLRLRNGWQGKSDRSLIRFSMAVSSGFSKPVSSTHDFCLTKRGFDPLDDDETDRSSKINSDVEQKPGMLDRERTRSSRSISRMSPRLLDLMLNVSVECLFVIVSVCVVSTRRSSIGSSSTSVASSESYCRRLFALLCQLPGNHARPATPRLLLASFWKVQYREFINGREHYRENLIIEEN